MTDSQPLQLKDATLKEVMDFLGCNEAEAKFFIAIESKNLPGDLVEPTVDTQNPVN